jgi:hypothetical protein
MVIVLFQARQELLDDRVPAVQTGLRYTAEGSTTRNELTVVSLEQRFRGFNSPTVKEGSA